MASKHASPGLLQVPGAQGCRYDTERHRPAKARTPVGNHDLKGRAIYVLDVDANSVLAIRQPDVCGESGRHHGRSLTGRCVEAFKHRGRLWPLPKVVVADRKQVRATARRLQGGPDGEELATLTEEVPHKVEDASEALINVVLDGGWDAVSP